MMLVFPLNIILHNTIDLEFSFVEFISLPERFNVIDLRKENDEYFFNDNKEHFVIASTCRIGMSQFDCTEDIISNFSLKYDQILMVI